MNILITAIGSFSADCVVNTLRQAGHKVIGCDIYPSIWHAVSKDCNKVYQVPLATEEEKYVKSLLKISKKERIQYIMPLTDLEIDVLNRYRTLFDENKIVLCIQSEKTLAVARNKEILCKLFHDDKHVNIPIFVNAHELEEDFPLPAVAKPLNGRSSEGLKRIYNLDELICLKGSDNYIVQKMISGSVFTVDYIRDKNGIDFAVPREELVRTKNGAGTTVKIVVDQKLKKLVSYIGHKIGVVGCVNMEFIGETVDKYYLIDINPRFSAGVAFSNFIGYDMVTSHFNCFWNEPIQSPVSFDEQIICKRYREELLWRSNEK